MEAPATTTSVIYVEQTARNKGSRRIPMSPLQSKFTSQYFHCTL